MEFLIYFSISSYLLENSLLICGPSRITFPLLTIPWIFHKSSSLFTSTMWNPPLKIPSLLVHLEVGGADGNSACPQWGGGGGWNNINSWSVYAPRCVLVRYFTLPNAWRFYSSGRECWHSCVNNAVGQILSNIVVKIKEPFHFRFCNLVWFSINCSLFL